MVHQQVVHFKFGEVKRGANHGAKAAEPLPCQCGHPINRPERLPYRGRESEAIDVSGLLQLCAFWVGGGGEHEHSLATLTSPGEKRVESVEPEVRGNGDGIANERGTLTQPGIEVRVHGCSNVAALDVHDYQLTRCRCTLADVFKNSEPGGTESFKERHLRLDDSNLAGTLT